MPLGEEYSVSVSEIRRPRRMRNIAPTVGYLLRAVYDV